MNFLRQSTAVDIPLGPFVSNADAVTPQTALTIAQADVRLKKGGGAWAQKSDTTTAAHEENGWYEVPLNTTDTDTLGLLVVAVNESGALPVWREFQVVTQGMYDALFGAEGDVYQALVSLVDDNGGSADRYTVLFLKNGQPVTTGFTGTPQIQVVKAADGTDLIAATNLTQISTTGRWRYNAAGAERVTAGAAYYAVITATIDGASRTMHTNVTIGRDS